MEKDPSRNVGNLPKIVWTDQLDQRLVRLREQGSSLRAMARVIGLNRSVVTARAIQLGFDIPKRAKPEVKPTEVPVAPTREPLAAGDPLTWSLITHGTCLEGNCYTPPSPVRARRNQAPGAAPAGE